MKNFLITAVVTLISFAVSAQETAMADTMRADGKIYVVVAVAMIVMLGLIGYVFSVDKKVSKLEEQVKDLK